MNQDVLYTGKHQPFLIGACLDCYSIFVLLDVVRIGFAQQDQYINNPSDKKQTTSKQVQQAR